MAIEIGRDKSAYGKSGSKYLNWSLRDHSAIHIDAKRTGKWLSTAELQLFGGKRFPGPQVNLFSQKQFVKSQSNKIYAVGPEFDPLPGSVRKNTDRMTVQEGMKKNRKI